MRGSEGRVPGLDYLFISTYGSPAVDVVIWCALLLVCAMACEGFLSVDREIERRVC